MKIINFLSLVSTTGAGGVDKIHLGMSMTQSSTLSNEKEKQGREGGGERERVDMVLQLPSYLLCKANTSTQTRVGKDNIAEAGEGIFITIAFLTFVHSNKASEYLLCRRIK